MLKDIAQNVRFAVLFQLTHPVLSVNSEPIGSLINLPMINQMRWNDNKSGFGGIIRARFAIHYVGFQLSAKAINHKGVASYQLSG